MDLDDIAQNRLDALEVGEFESRVAVERWIGEPARLLREYRYRFDQKRRELIRDVINELIDTIDGNLRDLSTALEGDVVQREAIDNPIFDELKDSVDQINTLLGSSVERPERWSDLHRHMRFGMLCDLQDIIGFDWPSVRDGLRTALYGEREPVPVEVEDLGVLANTKPRGQVATELQWKKLTDKDFERLLFALISFEQGYENPKWLTKTNAPDRGRDLEVYRVHTDPLAGVIRQRVIIQC